MMDWLRVYNEADIIPSIEAVDKTRQQYYPDEIDMHKDAVSIQGISMTYVLNKPLKMKKCSYPDLYALGQPCLHKCEECKVDTKCGCDKCRWVRNECTQCMKNKSYELIKTGMVGGPSIVFTRYHEVGKSRICDDQYHNAKTCTRVIGFNANSHYLYCSGQEMPCSKEEYVETSSINPEELCDQVLKGELFGFL